MNAPKTRNLALPFLQPGQALKTVTHNEAVQRLDTGLYLSCSNMSAENLPDDPPQGLTLILSQTAPETLTEHVGDIAVFNDGLWVWFTPKPGWSLWDEAAQILRIFDGVGWVRPTSETVQDLLPQMGINISAAPTQRLAVASETSLFSHDGDSHRMNINRAADTDTASLIFQTDYAGQAEFGLTGQEGFSIKTSADGTNWLSRLTAPDIRAGIEAPSYNSLRVLIPKKSASFVPTPETGGLLALVAFSSTQRPIINRSALFAYDTGGTPGLESLALTSRVENHGTLTLDGTISAEGNLGVSAGQGGLYIENRDIYSRLIHITFLC